MDNSFIIFLTNLFFSIEEKGQDGFMLIGMTVPLNCLWKLYERLKSVDVPPIETISEELKLKYWSMGKKYQPLEEQAIKASKAAYVLSLITNS